MNEMELLMAMNRILELRQIALENAIRKIDPNIFEAYQKDLYQQIDTLVKESPQLASLTQKYLKKN